jgi:hypothetical protein
MSLDASSKCIGLNWKTILSVPVLRQESPNVGFRDYISLRLLTKKRIEGVIIKEKPDWIVRDVN